MNKCKTCKHWKPILADSKQGECIKLSECPDIISINAGIMVNMEYILDEIGWEGTESYDTGENFGCIHHEQK